VTPGRRRAVSATVVGLALLLHAAAIASAQPGPTAPPPTPVPPNGSPSPFPSALRTPSNAVAPPTIDARAALLADLRSGAVLFEQDGATRRPIASLTKVMTAVVVLEHTELDDRVVVDPRAVFDRGDFGASATLGLRAGERVTVSDLLHALLLGSANDAASALAIHVSGSVDKFVRLMNERARALGMNRSVFFSPSGLDDRGRSTPRDLLRLASYVELVPEIERITQRRFRTIAAARGPDRRIQNRNAMLWLYPGTSGTKTGFTYGADYCLLAIAERDGRRLVAIVLGSVDEAFSDAASLLNHGFEGFSQETFVAAGAPQGTLEIRGGTVPVIAGETLTGLVPIGAADAAKASLRVDPRAVFPPAPGEPVGSLTVRAEGLTLGTVPLVVDRVPPPTPLEGAWWARAATTLIGAIVDGVRAPAG
jgi:serine-type D-Ala-D-Ala carboxypeptidase (penicillin-binding protein 5/6)